MELFLERPLRLRSAESTAGDDEVAFFDLEAALADFTAAFFEGPLATFGADLAFGVALGTVVFVLFCAGCPSARSSTPLRF